jgi:cytochrome c-type biogenesis protein CcmH
LQRYADAANAYAEANARNGGADADSLSGEAEARIFADPRSLSHDTAALLDRALAADPADARALWFGGMADAQFGNLPRARERWGKLASMPLPAEAKAAVDKQLAELDAAMAESMPGMAEAAAGDDLRAPPPGAARKSAAVALDVTVSVDPALVASIPAGATLFVYAQAAAGPPMPLAVYRKPVGSFPVEVRLDDSMAMTPAMRLSSFANYKVTARISASGGAQPESGDLEGSIELDRASAANPARIVIEHKRR